VYRFYSPRICHKQLRSVASCVRLSVEKVLCCRYQSSQSSNLISQKS